MKTVEETGRASHTQHTHIQNDCCMLTGLGRRDEDSGGDRQGLTHTADTHSE